MLWLLDQFAYHSLDDTNVSIEDTTDHPTDQCHPEVGREAHDQEREHRSCTTEEQDRLSTYPVRKRAPKETSESLREGKGGYEDPGIERGIATITDVEALDEKPGIWKDGCQGNWFGDPNQG